MPERYEIRAEATSSELVGDELMIINFDTSYFYGLNHTGRVAWDMLVSSPTADELADALAESFGVAREQTSSDVAAFLGSLSEAGLIMESGAGEPRSADFVIETQRDYEAPVVEQYERLEQLILSGE